MGDGCICKFFADNVFKYATIVSGHAKDDFLYFKNRVTVLFNKFFGITPSIKFLKSCNGINTETRTRAIAEFFLKMGFPLGKKGQIKIPKKMLKLEIKYINRIIRGLFDTDGCFFARKDEDYRYPYVEISSSSIPLRKQLKELLISQGFPAYIHSTNLLVRGIANATRWFETIGSSHPVILERFKTFKETGRLLPKRAGRSTEEVNPPISLPSQTIRNR